MRQLPSVTFCHSTLMLAITAFFLPLLALAGDESNHSRTLKLIAMHTDSLVANDSCASVVINRQDAVKKVLPELHHLPELASLELISVRLDVTDIEAIAKCSMNRLAISFCPLDVDSLRLLAQLKHLRSLVLIDGGITDKSMAWFSEFHELEELNLSVNRLTGSGFKSLHKCTKLKRLVLNGTQLTSDSIPLLLPFRQLEHLDMGETAVTARGIEALAPLIWLNEIGAPDGVMTVEAAERFRMKRFAAIEDARKAGDAVPSLDGVPYSVTERMPSEGSWSAADFSVLQDLISRSSQRARQLELDLNGWKGELVSPASIGFPGDAEDGVSSKQFAWQFQKGPDQKAEFVLTFGHYSGVMGSIPVLADEPRDRYPHYRNFGDESRLTLPLDRQDAKMIVVAAERLWSADEVQDIVFHSTLSVNGDWDADLQNTFVRTYQNSPNGKRPEQGPTLLYRVQMITAKHVSAEVQHEILAHYLKALSRAMKWSSAP